MEYWKMYAKIGDIDDIMMVTFLSDVRNNAKSFEELRAIWAMSDLLRALQALKTKVVAARQAGRRPFAAAISGADTPKFRKQSYTFVATWKS